MNLRLDERMARVRVTREEAIRLAESGELTQRLPMLGIDGELRVGLHAGDLRLEATGMGPTLQLRVPRSGLEAMLALGRAAGELRSEVVTRSARFEVSFEIDRFTRSDRARVRETP